LITGEERKALAQKAIDEVVNKGNMTSVDEFFAANYIFHAADGTQLNGPAQFKQYIMMFRGAFPDIYNEVNDIACDGDLMAVRTSFTGTNTGSLRGMPPTGKKVAMQEALFYRWEGDKIAEEWQFINQMALLQQLGMAPLAAKPGG
jgi:steroid delta-isomerase-like uncharacterized protein